MTASVAARCPRGGAAVRGAPPGTAARRAFARAAASARAAAGEP